MNNVSAGVNVINVCIHTDTFNILLNHSQCKCNDQLQTHANSETDFVIESQ